MILLLYLLLLYHLPSSLAQLERVVQCPCSLRIARPLSNSHTPTQDIFDILVYSQTKTLTTRSVNLPIEPLSHRHLSSKSASHSDPHFLYYTHNISIAGTFRVAIRKHRSSPVSLTNRQFFTGIQCPVLLRPNLPKPLISSRLLSTFRKYLLPKEPPTKPPLVATPNVVGGNRVTSNLVPYMVVILTSDFYICSGVLISPTWFLTAAHCNVDSEATVYVMSSQYAVNGHKVSVSRVFRHPRFGQTPLEKRFDILAVELVEDVRRYGAKFMEIGLSVLTPDEGTFVRVLGYGAIRESGISGDRFPFALRQVDLPVASFRLCRNSYGSLPVPTLLSKKHQFCAGYSREGGCDACFGDSGGPLIQYAQYKPVLRGLVSRGAGCAAANYPGVNVRLSAFKDWLRDVGAPFTQHTGPLSPVRTKCRPGEYLKADGVKIAKCTLCPIDQISPGGPVRQCDQCPGNSARDPREGFLCSCRGLLGMGKVDGRKASSPECVVCAAGYYSGNNDNKCRECNRRSFSSTERSERCERCPSARRGATSCPTTV